ncbi:hypothetical protein [Cohnella zeiphila]|uniref:Uncharacterized protein n=1 Tax=Cohnella zeiphila TaxID=2761120 RepID=A0A7X0SSF1_9BACL|nr:hypothetical protein [Cohnella zeiphila]MBB6734040.1 hypothetical protein [Cohnella zeiphila]
MDNTVQISKDNGAVWKKYDTDEVDAKEFAKWLLINDSIPGQIELVQPEKISSILIDGLTSAISAQMLKSFYDLLVSNNILSKTLAKQDYSERMKYLEKNLPNFIVTKLWN